MAKSTSACNSILALIFNATAWADIAQNDGSGPLTDLYISLHTDTPGVGGSQETNEATYGDYARIPVVRTTSGWEIPAAGSTSNAAIITFDECASSTNIISYVAIGTALSGAGLVLYAGALSSPRTVSTGIQPQFNQNTLVVTES
jgi:hypothetical protein